MIKKVLCQLLSTQFTDVILSYMYFICANVDIVC